MKVPMCRCSTEKVSGNGRVEMKNEDDGRLKEFEVVSNLAMSHYIDEI